MFSQPKKIANNSKLTAEIMQREIEKQKLDKIREEIIFSVETADELTTLFKPNNSQTGEMENPLTLKVEEMQKLRINSVVIELDKLTQKEILNLIKLDFPELQLQIDELSKQITGEINSLGIYSKEDNFTSILEASQKETNLKRNIIYLNSTSSIISLAGVFIGATAFPVVSISFATANLLALLNGKKGREKLQNIIQTGQKRLKEILAKKILEKYDQKNSQN